ncbi:MAG TPA: YfhO family protein [Tepidisphaeraceae bacterium]|jgi:hypothetical protein
MATHPQCIHDTSGRQGIGGLRHVLLVMAFFVGLYVLFFAPVLFTHRLLAPGDGLAYYLPTYQIAKTTWSDLTFSGFPLAADPQAMTWYPPARILALLPHSWNVFVVFAYVLASTGMYFFVRAIARSTLAALAAGIIFGLSGFMIAHLGHTTMIHAVAWLPLMLLCAQKLRSGFSRGWFIIACLSAAMSILAGHPPIALFCLALVAAYMAVFGLQSRAAWWRYYGWGIFIALFAVGLSAIQILPSKELANRSLRDALTFAEFVRPATTLQHLITLIFPYFLGGAQTPVYRFMPYVSVWNYTEVAGYVGILPIVLAMVAIMWAAGPAQKTFVGAGFPRPPAPDERTGRGDPAPTNEIAEARAQVLFWAGVAVVALLLSLGDVTPLAGLMYHIPGFRSFRAPARHLLEFDFAVAILAAFGVIVLQGNVARATSPCAGGEGRGGMGRLPMPLFALMAIAAIGVAALAFTHRAIGEKFRLAGYIGWTASPLTNAALGVPVALFVLMASLLLLWPRTPRRWPAIALLALLLIDLGSFGWFCEWRILAPATAQLEIPSVLAPYRDELMTSHQRLLTFRGYNGDIEEAKPNLCSIWGLPNASGLNPLIITRYARMLKLDRAGGPDPSALAGKDLSIDLLAIKYVLGPNNRPSERESFPMHGREWSRQELGIEFTQRDPSKPLADVDFTIPDIAASEICFVSTLGNSIDVTDGTPLVRVTVTTTAGETIGRELLAGEHTSEWSWDKPMLAGLIKHRRAFIFDSARPEGGAGGFDSHRYLAVLPFGETRSIRHISLKWVGPLQVGTFITHITLRDERESAARGNYLVTFLNQAVGDPGHWKKHADLQSTTVYENLRAFPRAWLTYHVAKLEPQQILDAIHDGGFPDGSPFDPKKISLVESPIKGNTGEEDAGASVEVVRDEQSSIELKTRTRTHAFLNLSDVNFRGWHATVNGKSADVYQTDYALRGVFVPSGENTVRFFYRPTSLYTGAAITLFSAIVLLVATWLVTRKGP